MVNNKLTILISINQWWSKMEKNENKGKKAGKCQCPASEASGYRSVTGYQSCVHKMQWVHENITVRRREKNASALHEMGQKKGARMVRQWTKKRTIGWISKKNGHRINAAKRTDKTGASRIGRSNPSSSHETISCEKNTSICMYVCMYVCIHNNRYDGNDNEKSNEWYPIPYNHYNDNQ